MASCSHTGTSYRIQQVVKTWTGNTMYAYQGQYLAHTSAPLSTRLAAPCTTRLRLQKETVSSIVRHINDKLDHSFYAYPRVNLLVPRHERRDRSPVTQHCFFLFFRGSPDSVSFAYFIMSQQGPSILRRLRPSHTLHRTIFAFVCLGVPSFDGSLRYIWIQINTSLPPVNPCHKKS